MNHILHPDPSPFWVLAGDATSKERVRRMLIESVGWSDDAKETMQITQPGIQPVGRSPQTMPRPRLRRQVEPAEVNQPGMRFRIVKLILPNASVP